MLAELFFVYTYFLSSVRYDELTVAMQGLKKLTLSSLDDYVDAPIEPYRFPLFAAW